MKTLCDYPSLKSLVLLCAALMTDHAGAAEAVNSALWGADGAAWTPESRLPDFSHAGYRRGERPLPNPERTHNVRDFGATGDGETDDSDAFLKALAEMPAGVLWVPEGRYRITRPLRVEKSNIVIRGAGPEKTILYCPVPLNVIEPNDGATTGGRPTSNYSWSGGFVTIQGRAGGDALTSVAQPAARGSHTVEVTDSSRLRVGQEVALRLTDDEKDSLAQHLYDNDPRTSIENLNSRTSATLIARIVAVTGNTVTIDRPLRFDIRPEWKPTLYPFAPEVVESGLENVGFEFPNTPYEGHFTELGFNAFALSGVAHCWVRNIRVHNSDSGGFVSGNFNTVDGIVLTSVRSRDKNRNSTGHHGVSLGGDDNLCTNFDFQTMFVHDLTTSHSAGNVYSNGKGEDLSFDHHCRAPYENLFSNIDVGKATRVWSSGGGKGLGAHCGARGTFWNIHGAQTIAVPEKNFGPWSLNLIGVQIDGAEQLDPSQRWYEHPEKSVMPRDLHEAQRARRVHTPDTP